MWSDPILTRKWMNIWKSTKVYTAILFQGAKKVILKLAIWESWSQQILAQTSFQLAHETFWWAELISQFFCNLNSSKNFTCPLGKLRTEFTSAIAKSISLGLSHTTFFARCFYGPCILEGEHWRQSKIIGIKCLKITVANLRRIGLKMREWRLRELRCGS